MYANGDGNDTFGIHKKILCHIVDINITLKKFAVLGGGIYPPNSSVYASQDNIRFVSGEIGCLVTGLNERMSRKFLNKTRTFFLNFDEIFLKNFIP